MRPSGWDACDFDGSEPDWMALFRMFFLDNFPSRIITFQVVSGLQGSDHPAGLIARGLDLMRRGDP
jgi:hypothetical protein